LSRDFLSSVFTDRNAHRGSNWGPPDSVHRRPGPIFVLPDAPGRLLLGGDGRRGGYRPDGIRHDAGGVELGRDSSGQVPVLALDVPADGVVPGEGPRAVGAGDTDALVSML
jgi:hypothetical protein